jgi:uncharacterized small protein (DUF1192 family)
MGTMTKKAMEKHYQEILERMQEILEENAALKDELKRLKAKKSADTCTRKAALLVS